MQENTRPLERIIHQNENKKSGSETMATDLWMMTRAVHELFVLCQPTKKSHLPDSELQELRLGQTTKIN
jgi:hypothetical protein